MTKQKRDVFAQLPLPDWNTDRRLTRTQLLFKLSTGIDPRAFEVGKVHKEEFFLFVQMRRELQWTTFGMTSSRWTTATQQFNRRLEAKAKVEDFPFVPKSARALQAKLGELESLILVRVCKDDYKCKCI